MSEQSAPDQFFFPTKLVPHTEFGPRHAAMMATVRAALARNSALHILEIGAWCGASAMLWAESIARYGDAAQIAASSITCVDAWKPYFTATDLEDEKYRMFEQATRNDVIYRTFCHNAKVAQARWGVRVDHIRGLSEDVYPDLEPGHFNLIYIDGSHYFDDVRFDMDNAKALAPIGGMICGDDLEAELHEVDGENLRAHLNNDFIRDPKSGTKYHPGVTLAMAESFSAVTSHYGYWITRKIADESFGPEEISPGRYFMPSFLSLFEQNYFVANMASIGEPPPSE